MRDSWAAVASSLFLATIACASAASSRAPDPEVALTKPVASTALPPWATRGSGAFREGPKRILVGVGAARPTTNPSLSISTANVRARSEISNMFERISSGLLKEAMIDCSDCALPFSGNENAWNAMKTIAARMLEAVEIKDRFVDPQSGEVLGLAHLDLDGALEKLAHEVPEATPEVVAFIMDRIEKEFAQLEHEGARTSP